MRSYWKAAILMVVYGILFYFLFQSAYAWMIGKWDSADFNYAYLIPAVILYIIWEKRDELHHQPTNPTLLGLIPLLIGVAFYWLGELGGEFYTLYLSSFFLLIGILLLHLGWRKVKVILFPLFLILTMFPPPDFLYNKISVFLKLISSKIGVAVIQLFGLPAYREGNVIDLGFTQLQVVDACSGLRYLIPLIVLGLILAYFYRGPLWKKIILVLSTVPLSILLNSIRIASTGILSKYFGPKVAEGFFHDFSGWIIFIVSFAFLLLEMWILSLLPGKGKRTEENQEKPTSTGLSSQSGHVRILPYFLIIMVFLGGTLFIQSNVDFRQKIPIAKPFREFPTQIGYWEGERLGLEQSVINTLDLSDYLMIDYKKGKLKRVNLYVAYYESQQKGESIHSPATCLPGGGWLFIDSGARTFKVPSTEESMTVNRAFMQKGPHKQLTYYWFSQRGRILQNAYQLKFFVFWDALTKQRTDGALVRVITPVIEGEPVDEADKRLQTFINEVKPTLNEFIPQEKIQ